jgi:hypothetical protein
MFNAMTDAPAVTVTAERRDALGNVTFLSDNLPFGGFSSYDDLGLERHIFDFVPNDGSGRIGRTFADFSAPEATQIAVIVGTGFVTPTANQNGPGYDPIFVNSDGRTFPLGLTSTPIEDESPTEIPDQFVLQGNYPNPFNPSTRIIFDLPETALVSLDVFDVTGRKVRSVPTQPLAAGSGQSITLDADNLPSGLYLYQLTARGSNQTYIAQDQMMLVR